VLLDQIADGQRLIRGYQRANQTDEKVVHANNVSLWKHQSRRKQLVKAGCGASKINFPPLRANESFNRALQKSDSQSYVRRMR
jgi:hypothetical protein